MLLFDDADTTTFNKTGNGIATGGDAWLTSDGEWITTDGTTHTWDKTQDIETSYGYNLRWVIVYGNSTSNINVSLYAFAPLIEFIDNEITYNGFLFGYSSPNSIKINLISIKSNTTALSYYTFYSCSALQYISLPNLTAISGTNTFSNCSALQHASLPNLATITGNNTFANCSALQKFIFNSNLINVNFSNIFSNCFSLKDVVMWNGWNLSGLNLSPCISMRVDSLRQILNALADVTEETGTYTLTFGATNLAKLTAQDIAIATNKGWTLN